MKAWFLNLEPRERLTLVIGAVCAILILSYALVWSPVTRDVAALESQISGLREAAVWMDRAADEVAGSRALAPTPRVASSSPLLTLVEQTAKQGGLAGALKRVEPQGADRARVWLEQASFDALVRWLADVQKRMGVYAESAVVDPQKEAGVVNARLVLRRGEDG